MSPDSSDDRFEDRSIESPTDAKAADAGARVAARRPSAKRSSTRRSSKTGAKAERSAPDDAGERLREHAADILAATRKRIVEQPVQAVLVAAAAGAFAALLLGAARR